VANDPNRAANEAAARFQKYAQDQVDKGFRNRPLPGTGSGQQQGGLLGFLIVVALIALVAFWIARQQ
jgi:hypothetical protein